MKRKRILSMIATGMALTMLCAVPAFAAGTGDVSNAVEQTWTAASGQLKTIDMILAIFFCVKLGTAYFDYRKHGQFEWAPPAILLACLIFTLTAPTYIWGIIGM